LRALSGVKVAVDEERLFSFMGKICDIDFLNKWKMLSIVMIRRIPYTRQFMANILGLADSSFGSPIAKEEYRVGVPQNPLRISLR
jgi:hypothetical protein